MGHDRPLWDGKGIGWARALLTGALLLAATAAPARALAVPATPARTSPDTSLFIGAARIVDGTGRPAYSGAVRIRGDRIVALGDLRPEPGERVVDARGLVLAPGFIDTHSHSDDGLFKDPGALADVSQGITTIVVGQDGGSAYPLARFFERVEAAPVAVNVASFAGHNTIRRRVMGADFRRGASDLEIERMRAALRGELAAGALGLSTGLEYDPGIYSTTEEVVALAREASRVGGRYVSHLRSEDRAVWEAVDEAIRIGREADVPVHISHMKLAMRSLWGQADRLLAHLDSARAAGLEITADIYPYTYWQSTMTVLFPERNFEDREAAAFALRELVAPDQMWIADYQPRPSYAGRSLAQIARLRDQDPVTAFLGLIAESQALERTTGHGTESIIATSMDSVDVARLLAWPHANFCTDGGLRGGHPRGFGSFPRVLGRYVRERGILSPEEAVRKATSLAAQHMGIRDRGTLRPGAYADMVLFDPDRILDRATTRAPTRMAVGVERVWVNGVEVYADRRATGAGSGRVIRRSPGR
ncbi:MAG: amidohydrolase family protein [Gemmatimonadota bacterium]